MPDRDPLIDLLTGTARRLRFGLLLDELVRMACWCFGILLIQQVLAALFVAPDEDVPMTATLVIALALVVVLHAPRLARKFTLARCAGVIDERARLHDELKTAYWLMNRDEIAPLAQLQIDRARTTARRVRPAEVVRIASPRETSLAVALLLAAAMLFWISPRAGLRMPSREDHPPGSSEIAAAPGTEGKSTAAGPPSNARSDAAASKDRIAAGLSKPDAGSDRAAAEQSSSTQTNPDTGIENGREQAGKPADDAGIAPISRAIVGMMRAPKPDSFADYHLEGSGPNMPGSAGGQSGVEGRPGPASASSVLGALRELFDKNTDAPSAASRQTAAGGATQGLASGRPDADQASSKLDGGPVPAGTPPPPGSRGELKAESNGNAQRGPLSNGADRPASEKTRSTGSGAPAQSDDDAGSDPVLGKQAMPLRIQLDRAKTRAGAVSKGETGDSFYAPTRSQLSGQEYQAVSPRARYTTEGTMNGERVPLAYRDVVRDYFLYFNRKEK